MNKEMAVGAQRQSARPSWRSRRAQLTKKERADHHEGQTSLGDGRSTTLNNLALVVALLQRASEGSHEDDADEDGQETESDLAGAESVAFFKDNGAVEGGQLAYIMSEGDEGAH